MGLMRRFFMIVKAKVSKMLDHAENPNETLDYSYEKQLELLQQVRRGVVDVATSKKRLELQTQKLEASVAKLDSQARQALQVGREDLARVALERRDCELTDAQERLLRHLYATTQTQRDEAIALFRERRSRLTSASA